MDSRLVELIMRFRTELIFDRLHDIGLVSCHFQSVFIRKRENGMKHIGLVRSRVNRRPVRYGMKTVSCKQKANAI